MATKSNEKSCCTPSAERPAHGSTKSWHQELRAGPEIDFDKVDIPGGKSSVGTDQPGIPDDGENPKKVTRVKPFQIGRTSVTNAQFKQFVDATGYVTEAEKFGWSFVFWKQVPDSVGLTQGVAGVEWWRRVDGANWRDINGPGTEAEAWKADHPVVQVSWHDAQAFARWAGGRLPTEIEWEHAARGGRDNAKFPWGDREPNDHDFQPCNIWQGDFPKHNLALDGFETTAPAKFYEPNGYGLYNLCGNVWEWTSDSFRIKSLKKSVKERLAGMKGYKLSKGGSFLCHESYCYRYRIAARSGTSPDSATTHHGFRLVWSAN